MKITEITVSSGRVLPHPHQSYANLRPAVSLRSSLEPGDNAEAVAITLRAMCEEMLRDHVELIMGRLRSTRLDADDLEDEEIEEDEDEED